jgi:hypothetical protein
MQSDSNLFLNHLNIDSNSFRYGGSLCTFMDLINDDGLCFPLIKDSLPPLGLLLLSPLVLSPSLTPPCPAHETISTPQDSLELYFSEHIH